MESDVKYGIEAMVLELRLFGSKLRRNAFQREELRYEDKIALANSMEAWADQLALWEARALEHQATVIDFKPRVVVGGVTPLATSHNGPESA
jgi:hypothetical protein